MKSTLLTLLILITFTFATIAQTAPPAVNTPAKKGEWKRGGSFNLAFNQAAYKDWAMVLDNVIGVSGMLDLHANYVEGDNGWTNNLILAYGQTKLGSNLFRKNDDRLDFTSKYSRKANDKFGYAALFNFRTVMTPGYTYTDPKNDNTRTLNSNFMSPGRFEFSLGMDYKATPHLTVFFSPLANRFTYVALDTLIPVYLKARPGEKANNTTQGGAKNYRYELGATLKAQYEKDIIENVNLKSRLELFTDYLDPKHNVDIQWDLGLNMKVNKYISASINTTMIYDDDIAVPIKETINGVDGYYGRTGARLQMKEVLGVGFAYKIADK